MGEAKENEAMTPTRLRLARSQADGRGLYVNVNAHNFFIPRGETVTVPRYIAEVVEHSARQDEHTAGLIDALSERSGA